MLWTLLRAKGWAVYVPSSGWHLSASDAGADVTSSNGLSDASLATWYQLGRPWSLQGLAAKILSQVSFVPTICRSPVERSAFLAAVTLWDAARRPLLARYTAADDVEVLPLHAWQERLLSLPFYANSGNHPPSLVRPGREQRSV